ncbi:MAG: trypsin-like serine protease, partial [Polyangiaceae bacterium]|nr:trypsin-like serine protease [Polyangiaceae bacterium]
MKTVNVGVFRTGCRRAKRIWLWGIIAPVGIAVGCNGGGKKLDVLETPGQSESALHNGAPAGVGMEDLHAVGMLRTPVSERCSGSLIGPDTMITAAHCLYPLSTGCGGQVAKPEDTYVVFADAHGNADGPGAQTIRVVGYAVHPLAWADRVTRCPDPDPPYVSCPTIPFARFLPSCNMVEVCGDRAADLGMRWEHDIALVYLESAPIGIEPLPVITSSSYNAVAPWVDNFLIQQQPYVTQVGYGDGSTDWSAPFPFERGRDMGTSMVVGIQETLFRHEKCGMQDFDQVTVPAIIVSRMSNPESYIDHGDSGGPLLVGPGPVAAGMVSPTGFSSLPSNTLEQRRHILGVASRGGNLPIVGDIPCSGPVDCPNEMVCLIHNFAASGFCARTCMDQSDCVMPGGGCYRPNPPDPGVCIGRFSYYAPTYIPENGDWIQAALDRNDIDLDGKPNHLDNCPGLPNPDQTNSNIDAEQDRQAVALGNACDPVPSPKFRIENMDKVPIGVQMGGCWLTGRYRGIQPTIIPEFTGSHNLINGAEVAQQNQVTEFRFCTPDAMQSRTCKVEHDQRRDIHFDIVDGPDEIWRTVTLTELGPKGASGLYDYPHKHKPNVSGYLTWDYWADIYEWVGDGWITSGIAIKPPNTEDHHWYRSSELVGTLGIRGGGPKSATLLGTIDNWTNGVHISPDLNDGYAMGQGIARSYDTVAPDPMDTIRGNKCAYCLGSCKPFVFDIAQLREYHKQLVTNPPNWMNKFDKTVLLNGPNGWGYVDSDGVLVETPGLIGYGLDSALTNQNHVYVPAAEPFKA